jgi:GTPase SAR1 family protein
VCGDVFVGKTQLVRQLLAMPYQSQYYATFGTYPPHSPLPTPHSTLHTPHYSTSHLPLTHPLTHPHIDSEVHKHKAVIRDVGFILKVVDVGGLDLDSVLNRDVLMTAQGFVLVYGANSRDSFIALERLRKKIQQNKSEARIPIVLVWEKGAECAEGT